MILKYGAYLVALHVNVALDGTQPLQNRAGAAQRKPNAFRLAVLVPLFDLVGKGFPNLQLIPLRLALAPGLRSLIAPHRLPQGELILYSSLILRASSRSSSAVASL